MIKMKKYYEVSGESNLGDIVSMIVTADTPQKAKQGFIDGDCLIPYFEGYDNSDWDIDKLNAKRLAKLDRFNPNDNFNLLQTLIFDYNWTFYDVNQVPVLDKDHYSDEKLREYLATGEIESEN